MAIVALAPAAMAAVQAGPFTNPANGHSYYLLNPTTWTASEAEAVTLGGHLVTVNDQAENDFLFTTFSPLVPQSPHDLWIGLTDAAVEGTFTWTSGEPVTYTHFGPGEPNNDPAHGGEDYVSYVMHAYSFVAERDWNDLNGTGEGERIPHGVVEVVPEPGALSAIVFTGCAFLTRRRRPA
jgi:hypothetical protein